MPLVPALLLVREPRQLDCITESSLRTFRLRSAPESAATAVQLYAASAYGRALPVTQTSVLERDLSAAPHSCSSAPMEAYYILLLRLYVDLLTGEVREGPHRDDSSAVRRALRVLRGCAADSESSGLGGTLSCAADSESSAWECCHAVTVTASCWRA